MNDKKVFIILTTFILIISSILRIINLRDLPGWYGDETYYLNIGWNIINGYMQREAISCTFFSAFMPAGPLFPLLGGIFMKVLGYDILNFRLVGVLFSIISIFFIIKIGELISNRTVGILSGFIYAITYPVLFYNRLGFPYNIYSTFLILFIYFVLKYFRHKEDKFILYCSILFSLSLLTVYYTIFPFLVLLSILILEQREFRFILKNILISLSLLITFIIIMLIFKPEEIIFDIAHLLKYYLSSKGQNIFSRIYILINHYEQFFKNDILFILGLIGIAIIKDKRTSLFLFVLFLLTSSVIFIRVDIASIDFLFYPAISFVFIPIIGIGIIFDRLLRSLNEDRNYMVRIPKILILIFIILHYLANIYNDISLITVKPFPQARRYYMTGSVRDAEEVTSFINLKCDERDFVICSTHIGWLLKCNHSDLWQVAAFEGFRTPFYPENLKRERFIFEPNFRKAKYFIIDNFTRDYMFRQSKLVPLINKLKDFNFEPVFNVGEFQVLENKDRINR